MKSVQKTIVLPLSPDYAFDLFVHKFNKWWPKEYTWSQEALQEIRIDGQKGGLCTEIGPKGFRCDWGRVTEYKKSEKIKLKWQISPKREPVPNPEDASDVRITFSKNNDSSTVMEFEHLNFENHGDGSEEYRNAMDSPQGWDYILNCYKQYCEG